jgi:hypothetical protein
MATKQICNPGVDGSFVEWLLKESTGTQLDASGQRHLRMRTMAILGRHDETKTRVEIPFDSKAQTYIDMELPMRATVVRCSAALC